MILYIIRGLPGSGKSTLAAALCGKDFHEADQYFMEPEGYKFDPTKLKEAHQWCLKQVEEDMKFGVTVVGVSNTFTRQWEVQPYLDLAAKAQYKVFIVNCENDFGSIHGVPEVSVLAMAERWENLHPKIKIMADIKHGYPK